MTPITYKQVLDSKGSLTALELWQDGEHITISLGAGETHFSGHRWYEIKKVIDRLSDIAHRLATEEVRY